MRFLSRILSRRIVVDRRDGHWRVGELAVCIVDKWKDPCARAPRRGELLRVAGVIEANAYGVRAYWLTFEGYDQDTAFWSNAFRKPVADGGAADAEFIARLKRARSSGGRPSPAPLPDPVPADAAAGSAFQPETSDA